MTRSRRHTPVLGVVHAKPGSERWFKRHGHRRWRQQVKQAMRRGQPLPRLREASNVWNYPKDGKGWVGPGRAWPQERVNWDRIERRLRK